jgi:hypothetical protein
VTQDSTPSWWTPPWSSGLGDPDASWGPAAADLAAEPHWHVNPDGATFNDDSILAPLEAEFGQVRSRERVRDLAEVFTHQREVDAILGSMPDAFAALDVKFLEPACGSGNFCVEILRRKLPLVVKTDCVSQEHYEHRLLRAIASIYGIDISPDNVTEARGRMTHVLLGHYQTDANTVEPTTAFLNAAAVILGDNIVCGDTLHDAHRIELCDWRPAGGARFQRVWSFALVPQAERDLFWAERVHDTEPAHYAELRAESTPAKGAKRRTARAAR